MLSCFFALVENVLGTISVKGFIIIDRVLPACSAPYVP